MYKYHIHTYINTLISIYIYTYVYIYIYICMGYKSLSTCAMARSRDGIATGTAGGKEDTKPDVTDAAALGGPESTKTVEKWKNDGKKL